MEFSNEVLKTSFTLPDKVTVRKQMQYLSVAGRSRDKEYVERLWLAARELIENWKSEYLPDLQASLDEVTDGNVTNVLVWASFEVKQYIEKLDEIPKNS